MILNDEASLGGIAYAAIAIIVVGFLWIGSGAVVDKLSDQHNTQISDTSAFPMSQAHDDAFQNLVFLFRIFLIICVILPIGLYAYISSNNDFDNEVI